MMSGKSFNVERAEAHQLSDRDFRFICQLVYDNTGIVLDERKRVMVYRRLMRRTRDLSISSFTDYCRMLGEESAGELPYLINAITTNLTSFFREAHHFDYLRDIFLPQHMQLFSSSRRLRIWSAGCSTGEEPYSIAMTLLESMGGALSGWDAKILATDLDSDVLETARSGIYQAERVKGLSTALCKRCFKRGTGSNSELLRVNPAVRQLITFKQLNLLQSWPMRGPFDVIMCRNVLIYFDRETQHALVERFSDLLRPGGLLMLGHSESIAKGFDEFEMLGRTLFCKRAELVA